MKRVLMISEHADPSAPLGATDAGGQNVYVDQVSRGVVRYGYTVDIYTRATTPDAAEPIVWADGVRIVPVPAGPPGFLPKDAIWQYITEFTTRSMALAERSGPYDLIHGNFWMSGWVGTELKRHLRLPLVQIFHALGVIKREYQGDADSSPPERCDVERSVIENADLIIAQCPAEADDLVRRYGADRARIRVVPSGVDPRRFFPIPQDAARAALGLPTEGQVIVYVGRLQPRKDVENILRGLALLRQAGRTVPRLLVVGGETDDASLDQEPEMRRLLGVAAELGIRDLVTFVGRKPADRLPLYYSAADAFVSTPWYEPYGLTPLEAMACGTPVICSAVGGITFTVADGETGFLVPPRHPEALADRIQALMDNRDVRARMARNARRRVEELFVWTTVAERTAAVYTELLEGQHHGTGASGTPG